MKKKSNNEENALKIQYNINVNGSLGLLALGDKGLRAWRKVRQQESNIQPKSTKK